VTALAVIPASERGSREYFRILDPRIREDDIEQHYHLRAEGLDLATANI
jgi:hypothetical protein